MVSASNAAGGGSVFVGRFNATGSLQESSENAVFVVGTGVSNSSRRNAIHVDSNNNIRLTGSVLISGSLQVSGSASQPFQILAGTDTAQINVLNAGPAFYRNANTYNTVIGNAKGIEDGFTGSNNLLFTGFFLGFKSGSNNTVISGQGGANFISGSNNTILGNVGNLGFGNNNTYLGSIGSNPTLENDTLRIGVGGNLLLIKSGSNALQIGSDTQVTGSLGVTGNVQFASGSNKTIGTVALDGGNPGTATVSNTLVTTSSLIFLTKQTNNHPNAGPVVVSSKGTNTFTITSNHNSDTDTVAYQIINPI